MTAQLGMYDMPGLHGANDRFWDLIRRNLGRGPDRLARDRDAWDVWLDPDLVLAQTCGMPYRTRLVGKVQLVGTPDYGLTDCPPGHYRSIFVARIDDDRSLAELCAGTFAFNETLSQSGWAAPATHLAARGLSAAQLKQTGAHAASARAVAEGDADFAALDALTWLLLQDHTDLGPRLREVGQTAPTPGLPLITARHNDPAPIAQAVRAAITDLPESDRAALRLRGLTDISTAMYRAVPTPPMPQASTPRV